MDISPNTVVVLDQYDSRIYFSFVEDLGLYEGKVTLLLCYDPGTGEFTEEWCD